MRFAHTHRMVFVLIVAMALLAAGCGAATSTAPADTGPAVSAPGDAATDKAAPSLAEVVREVKSGVIRIEVETCDDAFEGTGVLVGPRLIVTAEHVIDGAREIVLKQRGQRVGRGTVIGYDLERDVALVRSDIPIYGNEFVFAERAPRLGEEVAAIGFPLGLPLTVTHGFVSGLNRNLEIEGVKRRRLIQTDAAVNPGNSGGPLIALRTREVMGLVSAGSLDVNAIAFAIPSQTVSRLVTAWADSPQPVSRPECAAQSGWGQAQPAPTGGNGADTYEGNFASFDRLERCYADDDGATCTAGPSGQGATIVVGFDANYDGVTGSSDPGGPAMQMGTSFTTPGGAVTCDSSSRGITCTDNVTGSYFVIGDYSVVINNGGGEKRY